MSVEAEKLAFISFIKHPKGKVISPSIGFLSNLEMLYPKGILLSEVRKNGFCFKLNTASIQIFHWDK